MHDADEKLKDRIALTEMKDRQKNAQAVDRAIASHRRMHKEIAGEWRPWGLCWGLSWRLVGCGCGDGGGGGG